MKMQRDFPSHRIWREISGRTIYIARPPTPPPTPHRGTPT